MFSRAAFGPRAAGRRFPTPADQGWFPTDVVRSWATLRNIKPADALFKIWNFWSTFLQEETGLNIMNISIKKCAKQNMWKPPANKIFPLNEWLSHFLLTIKKTRQLLEFLRRGLSIPWVTDWKTLLWKKCVNFVTAWQVYVSHLLALLADDRTDDA